MVMSARTPREASGNRALFFTAAAGDRSLGAVAELLEPDDLALCPDRPGDVGERCPPPVAEGALDPVDRPGVGAHLDRAEDSEVGRHRTGLRPS